MPLTVEEARVLVPHKRDFYDAMRRNHYVMPAYNQRLVTVEWMLGVIRGTQWCLSSGEITCLHECVKPPSRRKVAEILANVMKQVNAHASVIAGLRATADLILEHPPDVEWMIKCLAQMDPNHEVFAKNYVPPKQSRDIEATIEVANLDDLQGFFANLPLSRD